jgi:hypothetical protein
MVGAIIIFARYGENFFIVDEIDQRSVQIISWAWDLAIDLAGKEFIAINRKIEIMGVLVVKILYKSWEDVASI